MACQLFFPHIFLAFAQWSLAIIVTLPTDGATYNSSPGPRVIEWQQEPGDPSECDIWLQKEGGNATYFAHVSVPSCRYDFSSWPTSLQPNGSRSLDTGEYCFVFTTTNSPSAQGQYLTESAHFLIQEGQRAQGLSTGAQAGIGISVGAVGLAIIGLCCYMFRREGRRHRRIVPTQTPLSKPELDGKQVARDAYTTAQSELSGGTEKDPPSELTASDPIRHELPGSTHQPYEAEGDHTAESSTRLGGTSIR
ncbi:hypothetical protein PV04_09172 [Phialophora macrospora]|uniref:Mid2 domain-containing protein n=1 Tax=Phialophora macrospora TaxID=1851006 RepID=A0A0D2CGD2_9EURO|nr:hypothetical protein PV04_09172 [Phialophora macrospora]